MLILGAVALSLASCDASAQKTISKTSKAGATAPATFSKTPGGLEYMIVKKGAGTYSPMPGDFMEMHVIFKMGDTTVINTDEMNNHKAVPNVCQQPQFPGDLNEGLMMLKAGDSAIFRMSLDTLVERTASMPQKFQKPPFAKPGDMATWIVKLETVTNKAEKEQQDKLKGEQQVQKDDQIIKQYIAKNNLKTQKTESGLYYVLTPSGNSTKPNSGQKVSLNYTGMLLDGTKFDSSTDPAFGHLEPLKYTLGQDHMIKGWDEGVNLMHKGDKIKLLIPSALAYGASGRPPKIPENSVLIFDMELVDFQ